MPKVMNFKLIVTGNIVLPSLIKRSDSLAAAIALQKVGRNVKIALHTFLPGESARIWALLMSELVAFCLSH